jgi:hypothetical protein
VGNSFPIQLADVAGAQPKLTYLSYTQALAENRLTVRLGRLTVNSVFGEEFMGSEYFKAMASVAFNLIPIGLFLNAPGAFDYPETTGMHGSNLNRFDSSTRWRAPLTATQQ